MASIKSILNIVFVVALLVVAVFSTPVPSDNNEAEPSNREGRFYGTGFGAANANAFASAGATGMGYPGFGLGSANAVASANAGATGFGYGK